MSLSVSFLFQSRVLSSYKESRPGTEVSRRTLSSVAGDSVTWSSLCDIKPIRFMNAFIRDIVAVMRKVVALCRQQAETILTLRCISTYGPLHHGNRT
uniref:Uncharacterized protein n=1 Tax=Hyaloperonospora arabidopsidis (strain Emoy2) TaxID=559515 RepID=M4C027_HYAAE